MAYVTTNAVDPTETKTQRQSFIREFNRRWKDVRGRHREWVEDGPLPDNKARYLQTTRETFRQRAMSTVLEPTSERAVARGGHWTANYVNTAYQKGLELARRDLRAYAEFDDSITDADIAKVASIHQEHHVEARQAEYLKLYYKIEDHIGLATSEVSDVAREAVENDNSRRWLAGKSNERIRGKVQNYEKALANTAVIRAVNEALLTTFEYAGVENVIAAVERSSSAEMRENYFDKPSVIEFTVKTNAAGEVQWATAGDENVCEVCQALEGKVLKIADIRGNDHLQPPIHPNCRCRLVPLPMDLVMDDSVIEVPDAFLEATGLDQMRSGL